MKAWATPLLAAGVGFAVEEKSAAGVLSVAGAALALWVIEAIWKMFQYRFVPRIEQLEAWFRDPDPTALAPFQIHQSWHAARHAPTSKGRLAHIPAIMAMPFVFLPYLPIILIAVVLVAAVG